MNKIKGDFMQCVHLLQQVSSTEIFIACRKKIMFREPFLRDLQSAAADRVRTFNAGIKNRFTFNFIRAI